MSDRGGARPTERDLTAPLTLAQLLREDVDRHGGWREALMFPGFHGIAVHRMAVRSSDLRWPFGRILRFVCGVLNIFLIRNLYGIEIYNTTVIGRRVLIGHHFGVLLGADTVIGNDCLIRQHVTFGRTGTGDSGQPTVGERVEFGAGCTVYGGVHIGDDAKIGPGAIIMRDVPAGASVLAPPPRVLRAPNDPHST